jgi:hypothetical protein
MPFLEVLTRCYLRPQSLQTNIESLRRQTSHEWRQTFLVDHVGRGVAWANAQLADVDPVGDYIWVLDDDDACIHAGLVTDLQYLAWLNDCPAAFIVRMDHGPLGILPDDDHWQQPPIEGQIGASAIITRADVWIRHRSAWRSGRYASDFDFISAVFHYEGDAIYWHDCIASAVQRISRGEPERV